MPQYNPQGNWSPDPRKLGTPRPAPGFPTKSVGGVDVPYDSSVVDVQGQMPAQPTLVNLALAGLQAAGSKASDLLSPEQFLAAGQEQRAPVDISSAWNGAGQMVSDWGSRLAQKGTDLWQSANAKPWESGAGLLSQDRPKPSRGDINLPPEDEPWMQNPESTVSVPTLPDLAGKQQPYIASYAGPRMNTEAALAGLKRLESTANMSNSGQPYKGPSNEELARHAFGDPNSMAPGAPMLAKEELQSRLGASDYAEAESRAQAKMANDAIAGLHPAVQAGAEAEAVRKAYPAQAQAEGMSNQAIMDYRGRKAAAEAGANAEGFKTNATILNSAIDAKTKLDTLTELTPDQLIQRDSLDKIIRYLTMSMFGNPTQVAGQ